LSSPSRTTPLAPGCRQSSGTAQAETLNPDQHPFRLSGRWAHRSPTVYRHSWGARCRGLTERS
jgi:hypothetical protein